MITRYKIVVFVPATHVAADVRRAIGEAGGGVIGNYTFCTFSSRGIGRFRPGPRAHPHIGTIDKLEQVEEERIEFVCDAALAPQIIEAIKKVHPYETVGIDVYPLVEL